MKIADKISISFLSVALILTIIAGTTFYLIAKSDLQKSIYNNLDTVVASRAHHIETYLKMLQSSVVSTSKSVVLPNLLRVSIEDPKYQEAFETAVKLLKQKKSFDTSIYEYMILDKAGKVVASTDETSNGEDKSTDAFFLGAQKGVYIKDAYFSQIKMMPLIALSAPFLHSDTGAFLGVLVARVKLDDLYNIVMDRTGLGKTGEIYVINKYGYMITPSRFKEDTFLKEEVDTENARMARLYEETKNPLPEQAALKVFPNYRGVKVLGAHQYIPQMEWAVLAEIDATEAFWPLVKIRMVLFAILFIVPIVAWLLGIFIANLITAPLHELHKGTEIIGSGNLNYKIGTYAKDEVGQLSRAFDAMTANLKTSTTSIENLNKEISERKQAEEALKESEGRFRAIFDHANDGILLADEETKKFYIGNNTICQMLGYSLEEIKNLGVTDIHPKKDLPYVLQQFERQARREIALAKDMPVERKDGSVFYADVNTSSVTLAGRTYLLGIFRDITERKKMEDELFRLNRALKTISECNQSLVRATDESNLLYEICRHLVGVGGYRLAWIGFAEQDDNKTVRAVAQAEHEVGYSKNLNITWLDTKLGRGPTGTSIRTGKTCICRNILTDPDFAPWRDEAIRCGYASSISIPLIVENRPLGALNIYASEPDAFGEHEVSLLTELTNDLAYGIIVLRIRIEQKKTEESLKKLSSAIEQTADIVIITDKDGIIEYVNPAFEKLTGYTKAEAIGQTPRLIKSGKHDQKFYEMLWKAVLGGEVFHDTLINKKKSDEFYYAEKTITPIRDNNGNITHFVSVDKDITERKRSEGALIEAMKVKSDFTSTVSHELRTPLTAIKEGIAIVLDGSAGALNAEQKEFLNLAKRNVDRLSRLINDVLDFQKLEAHKMAFNIQENDINELVKEVHHTMAPLADKKSLELALQLGEGLPRVNFDRDKIVQVLTNLVSNAIKFTEKGSIVIASSRGDNSIQVAVKDSGPGIKEEDIGSLFQQFRQLEKITERKTGGTGLGLAISKEIIERHKGRIWAESEFGKGTTFWFILPVKAQDKILVIDDDRAMLDIIKNFLEKKGYGVTCSEKGLDAVLIIGRDKPDLVILDMKLKDISGFEIIGRLRSNKDTSMTPIIAMSGYPEELIKIEDRQEELALVSIAKPFDLEDLLLTVGKLLQRRF